MESRKGPKESLSAKAYNLLYEGIVRMQYKPGLHLDEKDLVSQLGIGRTPVREALLRLASEMLVDSHHNKGFVVRPITLQSTRAVFEALSVLEIAVATLAVQRDLSDNLPKLEEAQAKVKAYIDQSDLWGLVRSNNDFHIAFAECSGNLYLVKALRDVRHEANRLAYLSFGHEFFKGNAMTKHYASVIEHHQQIIEGLEQKDKAALEQVVNNLIQAFRNRIVLYLTSTI